MTTSPWEDLHWDIPLGAPPEVVGMAKNVHGFQPTDRYCLPDLWSLHLYGYTAQLTVDEHAVPIRPGYIGLTPPGAVTEYRYTGLSPHLFVHFRLPADVSTRRVRAMQDSGDSFAALYRRLEDVIPAVLEEPTRASARLWDVLWELSVAAVPTHARPQHPSVRKATAMIERRLSEPISVALLAQDVGVSYSYLGRLFQDQYGESVVGYIRRRRVEQAVHLLRRSTLPIKTIAAAVGIPDLQHFNKTLRQELGQSPRTVRESRD